MSPDVHDWPAAAHALIAELTQAPGRVAIVPSEDLAQATIDLLSSALGVTPTTVGSTLCDDDAPPTFERIVEYLTNAAMLIDLDILFWPDLALDPAALLHQLARKAPRIALWPGRIDGSTAKYSEPGRRDYYCETVVNALVLRPNPITFPDEIPFQIERIAS